MKVEKLPGGLYYAYRIRVPPSNRTPLQDVINWADKLNIDCIVEPGSAFVHSLDDALLFILRWA